MKNIIVEFVVALLDLFFRAIEIYKTVKVKGVEILAKARFSRDR